MLYSRGKHNKDSIFDMVRAIQIDHNAYGVDECTSNGYADDEQFA